MEAGVKALHNTDLEVDTSLLTNLTKKPSPQKQPNEQEGDKFLWFASRRAKFTVDDYRKRLIRFISRKLELGQQTVSRFSDSGRSKGWATVRFETEEAAQGD